MKRIFQLFIVAVSAMLVLGSCNKDDIDDLKARQKDLEERFAKLDEWSKTVNTNISTLQSLLDAVKGNKAIASVNAKADGSGYTIAFTDGTSVEILHGAKGEKAEAPVIGVKKDTDGKYYWTIDGEFMLSGGATGDKVCAEGVGGNAVAPKVQINKETNMWEIWNDGGQIWESTGVKATGDKGAPGTSGDAIFQKDGIDMTTQPGYAIFTLADGSRITVPMASSAMVSFDSYEPLNVYENGSEIPLVFPAGLKEGDITSIIGQVTNNAGTANDVKVQTRAAVLDTWQVEVTMPAFEGGVYKAGSAKVKVTAPAAAIGDAAVLKVTVLDKNGKESTASRPLVSQTQTTSVSTVEEVNQHMEQVMNDPAKEAEVVVEEKVDEDATIEIPTGAEAASLALSFPNGIAEGKTLTVEDKGEYTGKVDITVPEDNKSHLVINMPNASVTVNGQVADVTATTAEHTLIVAKDAKITGTLNIQGGNAEIYGTVARFGEIAEGSKIFWSAGTAEELHAILAKDAKYNQGVILTANISGSTGLSGNQTDQDLFHIGTSDREGYQPSAYDGYVFDGRGFSISGAAYNNLLAVYANDVVVKNLTLYQVDADKNDKQKRANGITVYRSTGAELENVTIHDCGKAGVIVNASTAKATELTINDCLWGGVNVSKGNAPEGGNRPEFTLVSGTFTNVPAPVYVDQNTIDDYKVTVPAGWFEGEVLGQKVYAPTPFESVYDGSKIASLIDAASTNGTVTLPKGRYAVSSVITVNKPVTIEANGVALSLGENGGFDVQQNLALNNITLDCNTPYGKAPLTITKAGVQFSADKLTLNQSGSGHGNSNEISDHALGIYVAGNKDVYNVKITLANSAINLKASGMQMGVVLGSTVDGQNHIELEMTNSTITAFPAQGANANRSFGVHIGEVTDAKVTLTGCEIEGMHYPVRTTNNDKTKQTYTLVVDNTVLTGYCGIASRGKADITIQNGSVLTGRNYYGGGSSNFSTITLQEGSANSTLTIDNSTITNIVTGDCDEDLISVRDSGITVNLRNNTRLIDDPDSTKPLIGAIYLGMAATVNNDGTTTVTGKEGIKLSYNDDDIPAE